MPSSADYSELLPVIQAISPESVVPPAVPVDVFIQEAENLFHWCTDYQAALEAKGLDWNLVTSLPVRVGACSEAQSIWNNERKMRRKAERQWAKEAPAAFDMRDQLVHDFRFAFRKDNELLARVDEIAQGNTKTAMVQDLNDLSVLGKAHLDLLVPIQVSAVMLEEAAAMADRMAHLLGATNSERKEVSEAMIIRDKAYTYLKQAVDEIRECGKFAFWRNPDRLKGYVSEFWQKKNAAKTKAPREPKQSRAASKKLR
jgi:hypothetical protein